MDIFVYLLNFLLFLSDMLEDLGGGGEVVFCFKIYFYIINKYDFLCVYIV